MRFIRSRYVCHVALILLLASLSPASGQSLKEDTALKLVPADVSYFSTSLRLREQYDAFVNSNAFARLKDMPIVQMGWGLLQQQLQSGDLAQFMEWLEAPENQQLIALLTDAVSTEVFSYGDDGMANVVELWMQVSQAQQSAQFAAIQGLPPEQVQQMALGQMIATAAEGLKDMDVPQSVMGFRLSDDAAAVAQITRLETVLNDLFTQHPLMQGRLSRQQVGDAEFLTLKLDGTLIPWDQMPEDLKTPQMQQLREQVSDKTLVVSLGVMHGYLIVATGPSHEHLSKLGQGDLLVDTQHIAPLLKHGQQRVTSISYTSAKFLQSIASPDRSIDQMSGMLSGLAGLAGLEPGDHAALVQDIQGLGADIKAAIPKMGARSGIGFLSERGYESYAYDWGEYESLDGSKPLPILNHVGGNPILVVASRVKPSTAGYEAFAKWVTKIYYWADKIGASNLGPDERELYDKARQELEPLFKMLDQTTRESFLPAFRDGQGAFVLDAKTTNAQWLSLMPPADKPLPILEMALVYSVSDADSLKQAMAAYYDVAQQILDAMHRIQPEAIPEIQIPPADSRDFPGAGTVHFYKLPALLGVARHIAPNAGLSDKFLVLSYVPLATKRLLEEHPLQVGGPLTDPNRQMATAVHFDFAGLLGAIKPWVDYGLSFVAEDLPPGTQEQVTTGFEILQCLKGVTSASYFEGDVLVTHSETVIQDLAAQ